MIIVSAPRRHEKQGEATTMQRAALQRLGELEGRSRTTKPLARIGGNSRSPDRRISRPLT